MKIRLPTSLSLDIAYGIDIQSFEDPMVRIVQAAGDAVTLCGRPGAFLVDSIPIRMFAFIWMVGHIFA